MVEKIIGSGIGLGPPPSTARHRIASHPSKLPIPPSSKIPRNATVSTACRVRQEYPKQSASRRVPDRSNGFPSISSSPNLNTSRLPTRIPSPTRLTAPRTILVPRSSIPAATSMPTLATSNKVPIGIANMVNKHCVNTPITSQGHVSSRTSSCAPESSRLQEPRHASHRRAVSAHLATPAVPAQSHYLENTRHRAVSSTSVLPIPASHVPIPTRTTESAISNNTITRQLSPSSALQGHILHHQLQSGHELTRSSLELQAQSRPSRPSQSPEPVPESRRFNKPHPTIILQHLQILVKDTNYCGQAQAQAQVLSLDADELIAVHEQEQMEKEGMMKEVYREMLSWERWREEEDGSHASASDGGSLKKGRLAVFAQPLRQIALYASTKAVSKVDASHDTGCNDFDRVHEGSEEVGYEHDLPILVCKCVQELSSRGEAAVSALLDIPYSTSGLEEKRAEASSRLGALVDIFDSSSHYHKFGINTSLASETTEDVWGLLEGFMSELPEAVVGSTQLDLGKRDASGHPNISDLNSSGNGITRALWECCVNNGDGPAKRVQMIARLLLRLLPSANLSLFAYLMGFVCWVVECRLGVLLSETENGILQKDRRVLEFVRTFGKWMFRPVACPSSGLDAHRDLGHEVVVMMVWFMRHWDMIENGLFDEIEEIKEAIETETTPRVSSEFVGISLGYGRNGGDAGGGDVTKRRDSDLLSLCSTTSSALGERLVEASDVDSDIKASFSQLRLTDISMSSLPPSSAVDGAPPGLDVLITESRTVTDVAAFHTPTNELRSRRRLRVTNRAATDDIDYDDAEDSASTLSSRATSVFLSDSVSRSPSTESSSPVHWTMTESPLPSPFDPLPSPYDRTQMADDYQHRETKRVLCEECSAGCAAHTYIKDLEKRLRELEEVLRLRDIGAKVRRRQLD
ncbi:hypothetical protein VKT23_000124 [Stygiomarasmius scandens]|uniref:Rho-GAP domain-containing protein n=1 Tax=Marasmiellus scandens TaxID=2682957 RepID=A0ABR1K374_9AGAR